MEHAGFPSDETLAAFIDGRLDAETRRRVIEHIAQCEECWSVVMAANEMTDAPLALAPVVALRPRTSRWIGAAAGIALAAAVGIGFVVIPKMHRDDRAAIMEAAPAERPFRGRLSGFPLRGMTRVLRGGGDEASDPAFIGDPKFLDLAAKIADRAEKNPTVENLHNLGDICLLLGRPADAVTELQQALEKQTGENDIARAIERSTDTALLNDFSVASVNANASLALLSAERSFALAKTPEAAWNRAVATERLHGEVAAAAAWRDYEALGDAPEWKREYQKRIAPMR
jgi:hypothetical protein